MSRLQNLLPTLRMLAQPVAGLLMRWLRRLTFVLGSMALVMVILALTRIPFDVHRWLGKAGGVQRGAPSAIVVMGGSGMPSGPEIIRLVHAAEAWRGAPGATIHLVHALDTATMDAMEAELLLRGVPQADLRRHLMGNNTREQAVALAKGEPELRSTRVAVITAPENMLRTLGTFRKAGFTHVAGIPAFDQALFVELGYDPAELGASWLVPEATGSTGLRYTFWNYLKLEITCLREFVAIAYYRLNGWM